MSTTEKPVAVTCFRTSFYNSDVALSELCDTWDISYESVLEGALEALLFDDAYNLMDVFFDHSGSAEIPEEFKKCLVAREDDYLDHLYQIIEIVGSDMPADLYWISVSLSNNGRYLTVDLMKYDR